MSRSLGNKRGYESRQFTKTWSIYLPAIGDSSATPQQTSNSGASSDFPAATDGPGVAPGNGLEPPSNKECCTVALETGGPQEKGEEMPDIAQTQEDSFDDSDRREAEAEYLSLAKDQEKGTVKGLI